jgi:VWFA-related protein
MIPAPMAPVSVGQQRHPACRGMCHFKHRASRLDQNGKLVGFDQSNCGAMGSIHLFGKSLLSELSAMYSRAMVFRLQPVALAIFLLTFPSSAQPQTPQDGTIRVNTRLVQVSVVVRDKNGLVADLKKSDFTLLDNGKPEKIDVFSVSTTKAPARQAIRPGSGVISNLLNAAGEFPGDVTVVLFDLINVTNDAQENLVPSIVAGSPRRTGNARNPPPPTVGNAKFGGANVAMEDQQDAMRKLLAYIRSTREGEQTALYVLGDELKVLQDFTGDRTKLIRAAEKLRQMDAAGVEVRTLAELADLLEPPPVSTDAGPVYIVGPDFTNAMLTAAAIVRANATADALESIARHLSGFPGRKNLIWMTAGFPFISNQLTETPTGGAQAQIRETPEDFRAQLHRASKALNEANVALYPVDIQQLRGGYPEVMLRLADATGGKVGQHTNDLQGAVQAAAADGEVSYTLGFYPPPENFDGRTHDLKVKIGRKGVEVRHRSSYDAVAETVLTPGQRQSLVSNLLNSPLDATEIGLVAMAESDKENSGTYRVGISIDVSRLRLNEKNGRYTASLNLATHLASSKSKNAEIAMIPISLTDAQYNDVRRQGLLIQRTMKITPGDRLRVVVQDQSTGLAGSVWLPFGK